MNSKHCSIASILIGAFTPSVVAAEPFVTRGTIDAVTVYRGQAYVTRVVDVPGPAGLRDVVVTDLPDHVLSGSIYAEPLDGMAIRSVRARIRPVQDDVRAEVRELDEAIAAVNRQIEANQRHLQLLAEQGAYLDKLEAFVAPTVTVELSKGVLDTDTLTGLTGFLFAERRRRAEDELQVRDEERRLREEAELLQRKRRVVTGGSARTIREAVVFLDCQGNDGGQFRLRYMVNNASWTPSYGLRSDASRRNVVLDYYASIEQMSGEAWDDVDMALSTATPSLAARAPALEPLRVSLASPMPPVSEHKRRELTYRKQRIARERGASFSPEKSGLLDDKEELFQEDATLNLIAGQLQVLELVGPGGYPSERSRPSPVEEESVSVSYHLASRATLPSRSDQQMVRIASMDLSGDFYKLAIPVLTEFVYDEAVFRNDCEMVLLAGPVSTYVDGQFVGHGQIPMVSVGEEFTAGFGIDPSLRAHRELVEKRQSVEGGNRVVFTTYRLAVENFGDAPAAVRLVDRMPIHDAGSMSLDLVKSGTGTSDDPLYAKTDRKNGILRWDVHVPPQAVGIDAFELEFQYRLEHDKSMSLVASAEPSR